MRMGVELFRIACIGFVLFAGITFAPSIACAQQVRFPVPAQPGTSSFATPGSTVITPSGPIGTGAPVFNPLPTSPTPGIGGTPGTLPVSPYSGVNLPPSFPANSVIQPSTTGGGLPGALYPPPNSAPYLNPTGYPAYPNYPSQPGALFPNWQPGSSMNNWSWDGFNQEFNKTVKLLDDIRFRHTWLEGDRGGEVDSHDTEVGATLNFPNFLQSTNPLKISPGFILHLWDGPSPPIMNADLPANGYSGFIDFDWLSWNDRPVAAELNVRVGVFTDFDTLNTNSLRIQGTALGVVKFTPNLAGKIGVMYLDRVDVKILPAAGIFWQPTNDVDLELFFPRPRISKKIPQFGQNDAWIYAGAEYGGGSWTINRVGGFSDQVDLNDIRLFGGLRWKTVKETQWFFEAGYVFDRELVYRFSPADDTQLNDTFMLRGGFIF